MVIERFEVPDWIRSVLIVDPTDIWGNVVGIGLGELSAILSFAKRFDRRGEIIFLDGFETGLAGWFEATQGTGASIALSTNQPAFNAFCVHLTTGNADGDYAYISRYLAYPKVSKMGVGFSFTNQSYDSYIKPLVSIYTGSNRYIAEVRYNPGTGVIDFYNDAGGYTELATGVKLAISPYGYNQLKMVFDLKTGYYVRFLLNTTEYDMSSYPLWTTSSTTDPIMDISAHLETNQAASALSRIDGFVVTQNEP